MQTAKSFLSGALSMPPVTGYVSEIDALRCFAMTGVIAQHCQIFPCGWIGVWLFFVISGFAITTSLLASDRAPHSPALAIRNFYIRRCLRIWPLYFAFVAGNMICAAATGHADVLHDAGWLALFLYNFRMMLHNETWPAIGHLWTISVEEQFYLLFPFLFVFLTRRGLVRALLICIGASFFLRILLTFWLGGLSQDNEWKAFCLYAFGPAHFDAFAMGVLLALFRGYLSTRLALARKLFAGAVGVAALYGGVYIAINAGADGFGKEAFRNVFSGILWGQYRQVLLYTAVDILAASVIALILAGEPWLLALCRLPGLRAIGRISFGGYVFQALPLILYDHIYPEVAGSHFAPMLIVKFVLCYTASLLLAFLSFRYFEQPIVRLRKRYG